MANAQVTSQGSVSVTFSFTEVDAVSLEHVAAPNGQIDQGESALLQMNCSFTGFNTVATFSPSIGTFTTGTIRGFGSAIIDLNGSANNGGNADGSWLLDGTGPASAEYFTGLQSPFDASGAPGVPSPTGNRLVNVQPGQFPSTANGINTSNPALTWYGLWTPGSYADRTVTFQAVVGSVVSPGSPFAALLLRLNGTLAGSANVTVGQVTLGNVSIHVVPAPASLALLGLGGLVMGRRRR
jgi:hypothetical protein